MAEAAVSAMKPSQLKAILQERGVPVPPGAMEKRELVQLVMDSQGMSV